MVSIENQRSALDEHIADVRALYLEFVEDDASQTPEAIAEPAEAKIEAPDARA